MPDREKVLKDFADYEPYARDLPAVTIKSRVYMDALELLKEQEPKKPEWRVGRAHCPECGELFPRKNDTQYIRYCSFCGQAVTWDA